MTNGDIISVEGYSYEVFLMGKNVHTGDQVACLTLIGKRGKPVKQSRPATFRADGTVNLGAWMRI
jgi:hypothetical protein